MGQEKNISADGFLHAAGSLGVKTFVATKPPMSNVLPKKTVVGGTGSGTGYGQVNTNTPVITFPNQNANLPIVAVSPPVVTNPTVGVGVYNPTNGVDAGIVGYLPTNNLQGHMMAVDNTALFNYLNQNNPVIPPVVNPVTPPVVNPVTPPVAPPQTGGGGGGGGGGDTSGGGEADASQEEGQGESTSDDAIIDDSHDELSGELDEESSEQVSVGAVESDRGSYFAEGESKVMELKNAASKENEVLASMGLRGITNGEIVLASSIVVGLILLRIATR